MISRDGPGAFCCFLVSIHPCLLFSSVAGRLMASATGKRKGSACEQGGYGDDSQSGKATRSSIPDLPEDILFRIHSILPMREAARVACVSRAFLHSWRCHSSLIFTKDTIGLKKSACGENFDHKIDRILRNHSGCLKTFNLDYYGTRGFDGTSYFDRWLQIALKPGIEELALMLSETKGKYNFPCLLLSDGVRNSLRYLRLRFCALHPTVELGPLRSLRSLYLWRVSITWNELECLLLNSLSLELLDLISCPEIECLKLPCALQRLSSLSVFACDRLKAIEIKAPNLSSFCLYGNWLDFSLVETLPIKELDLQQANLIHDARAKLPSLMPNIEALAIQSPREVVDAPMLPTKFLHLKHLTITVRSGAIVSRAYDYFSLVSFLDASPCLETLTLDVAQRRMVHESVFADSQLRHMPEHRHGHLKSVKISGFNSAKCVVELACYILKNAVSLECLTLDTIYGSRCDDQGEDNWCVPMTDGVLMEIPWALLAIKTYIANKVPSAVQLTVLEPCSKCHAKGLERVLSQS